MSQDTSEKEQPTGHETLWLHGKSFLAKYIARPIQHFTHVEAASGVVLIISAVVAILWVNLGWGAAYTSFWHTEIHIAVAGVEIFKETLGHFVNDVLMVLFFLVVGLEIKNELINGRLNKPRDAALPVIAAVGGMAVPALVFVLFNAGSGNLSGWAIPSATDIAFALGIVSLLGSRIPTNLRIFLLTLAVADDLLAVLVIAIFYTNNLEFGWLLGAILVGVAMGVARHIKIWYTPLYFLLAMLLWWMTYRSGIHATIAGVAIGFLTPVRPIQNRSQAQKYAKWIQDKEHVSVADVRNTSFSITESISVGDRVRAHLHPFTSFIIVPIFALANSGIRLNGGDIAAQWSNPVTLGVFLGLLVGKVFGITLFAWIVTRLKISKLPSGMNWGSVFGMATVAGIGFTVAIFVSSLAFPDGEKTLLFPQGQAIFGVFTASLVAASVGLFILSRVYKKDAIKTVE